MKKRFVYISAVIVALILVYGLWSLYFSKMGQPHQGMANQGPMPVTVIRLETEKNRTHIELPGRVVAFKEAEIRPQVTGIITERLFTEGSEVKQGQQLYQIDPAPYQAAYDSAMADLAKAQANVQSISAKNKRYQELVKIEAISKQEYDDVQAELAQANADVAIASAAVDQTKINLDYTKMYAPISGRIGKSTVTKGALVTANQPETLTRITQLDPVYVDMTQPSSQLSDMRGQASGTNELPVLLFLENETTPYPHQGKLQFSDITVDQTTGSVLLRAIFNNPQGTLLPGLFVKTQTLLKETDSLLIPQKATTRSADGSLNAWVVDDKNIVSPRPIMAEKAVGDKWLVQKGLQAGDIVIIEGFQKIAPGTVITPQFANQNTNQIPTKPEGQ